MHLFKIHLKIITVLLLLTPDAISQIWFDIGLNAGTGTSFIMQKEFYQENQVNFLPQLNTSYSAKIGINFSDHHAIIIDLGRNNRKYSIDQNEVPNMDITETFRMDFGLSGFKIAPLYRNTKEGFFIEAGPEFGKIVTSYVNDFADYTYEDEVFEEDFIRGVLGIGGYVLGNQRVTFVMGLRLMYDFTDLRSSYGQSISFPLQNYQYSNSSALGAFDFQVNFELNISLGFLYRNKCGRRTLMFSL